MNRGLIEAGGPLAAQELKRTLPRFMNRGLIEAGPRALREDHRNLNFPDS